MKYFESKAEKAFKQYFLAYNDKMFAKVSKHHLTDLKLMSTCQLHTLTKDKYLYTEGEKSPGFYYVIDGQIELLFKRGDEFKMSRTVDHDSFFGFRKAGEEARADYAKITSETATILELDCLLHAEIQAYT